MKKLVVGVCAAVAAAVSAFADDAGALPPDAEGKELRFSMDEGETWTYYEKADAFLTGFRSSYSKKKDGGRTWIAELLCDAECSGATALQDADQYENRKLILRTCPLAGKTCTLKRTVANTIFDIGNYQHYPMTLEFQDIVLDGGAKWTNPLSKTATESEMLANTGIGNAAYIKCMWLSHLIVGSGTVVTNFAGCFFSSSSTEACLTIKDGARITDCRTATSQSLVLLNQNNYRFKMEGGVIDRCYARSHLLACRATPAEVAFSGGRIIDNVMFGNANATIYVLELNVTAAAVVSISGLEICGNYSQSTFNNYQPYGGEANLAIAGGGGGNNKASVYFTGHPIVRDNYNAVGKELGFTLHQAAGTGVGFAVTGRLERTAWLTLSSAAETYWDSSDPVQEGSRLSAIDGILEGVEADGFERIRHQTGSRTSSVGGDLRVYRDSEDVLRWTKTAVSMFPGSDLSGADCDLSGTGAVPSIFVTEISDELTAGLYDLSGTLTLSANTIFSIGSCAGVLEGVKEQVCIPLIQANKIVGFDAFLAAKEESLQLPKRWALIVREKDGKQQLCLKHTSPGLVILVR